MSSRERTQEEQMRFWSEECSYGEYLNAVDDQLELLIGRTSMQSELGFIAEMQEARCFRFLKLAFPHGQYMPSEVL